MEIIVNNEKIVTSASTLEELVLERVPETKGIAVAVGTTVIPKDKWGITLLTDQTVVTIIRATRGG